jgi:hypothetical protein
VENKPNYFLLSIDKFIYTTPRVRVEKPEPTELISGDVVKAKIGPAKGKIGFVVVDRNGNYVDREINASEKSIGVGFSENFTFPYCEIKDAVEQMIKSRASVGVVRWFDSPDQLEIIQKVPRE